MTTKVDEERLKIFFGNMVIDQKLKYVIIKKEIDPRGLWLTLRVFSSKIGKDIQ